MIELPTHTHVWIAAGHVDIRRGFNGMPALMQIALANNLYSGHVFVFRS